MPVAKRPPTPLTARIAATTTQRGGSDYLTTATSCTCPSYKFRRVPCKHMLALLGEPVEPVDTDEDDECVRSMTEFF